MCPFHLCKQGDFRTLFYVVSELGGDSSAEASLQKVPEVTAVLHSQTNGPKSMDKLAS